MIFSCKFKQKNFLLKIISTNGYIVSTKWGSCVNEELFINLKQKNCIKQLNLPFKHGYETTIQKSAGSQAAQH